MLLTAALHSCTVHAQAQAYKAALGMFSCLYCWLAQMAQLIDFCSPFLPAQTLQSDSLSKADNSPGHSVLMTQT